MNNLNNRSFLLALFRAGDKLKKSKKVSTALLSGMLPYDPQKFNVAEYLTPISMVDNEIAQAQNAQLTQNLNTTSHQLQQATSFIVNMVEEPEVLDNDDKKAELLVKYIRKISPGASQKLVQFLPVYKQISDVAVQKLVLEKLPE